MKNVKLTLILLLFVVVSRPLLAQTTLQNLSEALVKDDPTQLAKLVNKDNINDCYLESSGYSYCVLSEAIRSHAEKCFNWLISQGANVNVSCDGYVPPLMHAAKYGSLNMVKILIAKGANKDYKYTGPYKAANGETPLTYAEKYNQRDIVEYLRNIK